MAEDAKKISFSFKQLSAKPKTIPLAPRKTVDEKAAVQFIDCVEEKSIKVIGGGPEIIERELVIPAQPSVGRRLLVRGEKPGKQRQNGGEKIENGENGAGRTLDEIAVDAILSDCKKSEENGDESDAVEEVRMQVNPPEGSEEPSAENYDDVPVERFGLAMIRGMGWKPPPAAKKADKNPDSVNDDLPNRRPNGMGLGADKLVRAAVKKKENRDEELTLKIGSYVQFVLGRLDGQYGQVEGFDDGDGRVTVKIARSGQIEKVNENVFRLVTKSDYGKNSKVINIKKYKDYHEGITISDSDGDKTPPRRSGNKKPSRRDRSRSSDHRSRHHKTKKSKHSKSPHRKHKSDHTRHKKYKRQRSSS